MPTVGEVAALTDSELSSMRGVGRQVRERLQLIDRCRPRSNVLLRTEVALATVRKKIEGGWNHCQKREA